MSQQEHESNPQPRKKPRLTEENMQEYLQPGAISVRTYIELATSAALYDEVPLFQRFAKLVRLEHLSVESMEEVEAELLETHQDLAEENVQYWQERQLLEEQNLRF